MPQKKFSWPAAVVALVVAAVLITWLVSAYVGVEHPAYQWDYSAYWETFQIYGNNISSGGPWLRELSASIRSADYNAFGVIPLYPFYAAFGGGRVAYIGAVALTYLLPAVTLAAFLAVSVSGYGRVSGTLTAFLMALLYVPFWHPTFRGFIDISGLIFLGLATALVIKTDFLQRRTWIAALAIGVIIWMPFLLRRWYAFSVVSFFLVTMLFAAPIWWRKSRLKGVITVGLALATSGSIALALVLIFQRGLAIRVLNTSYNEAYAAYQVSFATHLQMAFDRFGVFGAALIVVGLVSALTQRNRLALYCLTLAIVAFALFTRTQALAEHHFLPIAFWLFPIYFLGSLQIMRALTIGSMALRSVPLVAASALIFYVSVAPGGARFSAFASVAPSNIRPLHLDNYDQYQKMVGYLKTNMGEADKFSVFSTRNGLSDSLLVNIDQSLKPRLTYAQQIDTFGLFHTETLRSKYLIVAQGGPAGVQSSQKVMTVPTEMLMSPDKPGFAAAFHKIGEYDLTGGIIGHLFERTRYPTFEEVRKTINMVSEHDADWHRGHMASMTASFGARRQTLGDTYGMAAPLDQFSLLTHPGNDSPTAVTLPLADGGGKPRSLRLSIAASARAVCPDADGVGVAVSGPGAHQVWAGNVAPGAFVDVDLAAVDGEITLSIDKGQMVGCDSTTISFLF